MLSLESAAKMYLNGLIYTSTNGIVVTGPFKGMKILTEVAWSDGNLGTKVLGCYEEELHGLLEEEIALLKGLDHPPIILDIGCSEGYYAVGMALRLPDAVVMGIDLSENALRITQMAADANDVVIGTSVSLFNEDFNTGYRPDFVICDCEGGEMDYIDPEKFPGLKTATILVECHDTQNCPVTKTMADRFETTHQIYVVHEGSRDPNRFEMLTSLPSLMRWLAVSEGRPCMMHWLLMRPR